MNCCFRARVCDSQQPRQPGRLKQNDFPQRLLDDLTVRCGAPARQELEDADVYQWLDALPDSFKLLSRVWSSCRRGSSCLRTACWFSQ
jgi:hypothetical protein